MQLQIHFQVPMLVDFQQSVVDSHLSVVVPAGQALLGLEAFMVAQVALMSINKLLHGPMPNLPN